MGRGRGKPQEAEWQSCRSVSESQVFATERRESTQEAQSPARSRKTIVSLLFSARKSDLILICDSPLCSLW